MNKGAHVSLARAEGIRLHISTQPCLCQANHKHSSNTGQV